MAEYDENFSTVHIHSGNNTQEYTFVTNEKTKYLRISTYNNGCPIIGFKYDLQSKLRSIFLNREIKIDKNKIVKGYPSYSDSNGFRIYSETTDTIYFRTDYIEIIPNSEIILYLFGTG